MLNRMIKILVAGVFARQNSAKILDIMNQQVLDVMLKEGV